MKMPGANQTQAQSLGRQNSSLAIQVGGAKRGISDAVVKTVSDVAGAIQREIVEPEYEREAAAQYATGEATRATKMTETESILNNPTGVVNVADIPSGVSYEAFDKNGDYREVIPTDEVAEDWYKQDLKESQRQALFGMSNAKAARKMKSEYNTSYMSNYANVLLRAQKRKQERELAQMSQAAEQFVEAGDQEKAERIWLGAIKTGVVGPKEGTEKLMAIAGDLDAYKVSRRINTGSLEDMDAIASYIYRDFNVEPRPEGGLQIVLNEDGSQQQNPMSFAQRKRLIGEVDARRARLTSANTKSRDDTSARILNENLIDLQDREGPLDNEELSAAGETMTATDHRTLVVANRALKVSVKTGTQKSDPATFGGMQMAINDLSIPSTEFTIQQRRGAVIGQINDALDRQELTGDDAWKLIQRVNTTEERAFDTPDMELATDQIYKRLTRGSKSAMGANVDSQSAINAADAERALFEAARAGGINFDALKWLDSNLGKYVTKNAISNTKKLTKALAKTYIVKGDNFQTDIPASRARLKAAIRAGSVQVDTEREVLRYLDLITQQRRETEEARRKAEDQQWSWPWE